MVEIRPVHLLLLCGGLSAGALGLGVVFLVVSHQPMSGATPSTDIELLTDSATSSPQPKSIVVDVEGAVLHPGVLTLSGTVVRMTDAIKGAGGLSSQADTLYVATKLNLAEPLRDGMKIYIPTRGEQPIPNSSATSSISSTVNVNTATLDVLETLKGVGQARAQAIIDNRPYTNVSELQNKAKLGKATIDGIEANISF